MPSIRPGGARRVLIENGNLREAAAKAAALRRAGFRVAVCGGPATLLDDRCPAVQRHACHLAAGADVILYDLELDDPADRAVLAALRLRWPDTPVVVESPADTMTLSAGLLRGCYVVAPSDPDRLVTAVAAVAHPNAGTASTG